MIAPVAEAPAALERALLAFRTELQAEPTVVARAPGRVNLIGEHVDYNDGFVLPAAIDRDIVTVAAPRADASIRVLAVDTGEVDAFTPLERFPRAAGWISYVRGVARLLSEMGVRVPGAALAISGDVPIGAGLSSSAALEVSVASALLALAGRSLPQLQLVELAHRAESEFAGVQCGIMDQLISVCGAVDRAVFLDCRSLEFVHLPVPAQLRLVATDSGVRRDLRNSAYNDRVKECQGAAQLLGVRSLRDIEPGDFAAREGDLPDLVRRRARHVVTEIERTRQAAAALERQDLAQFGRLMRESHESLRRDYEVSIPELDALVEVACEVDGVVGARLSGAGFGGCTISLVNESAVAEFLEHVPRAYRARTGRPATVHVCRAAAGASATDNWT
ncbi:MAG: galactokinase [Gemmatimonadetes bacterium]|nr:galactokinase [Gemmatimonadota bacterium]